MRRFVLGVLLCAPLCSCGTGSADDADDADESGEGGDGDDAGVCGPNLHDDDSTCENGIVDPGELCWRESGSMDPGFVAAGLLEVADFNADGHEDVMAQVWVYFGDGSGGFSSPAQYAPPRHEDSVYGPGYVQIGEIDGSPGADIIYNVYLADDPDELRVITGGPSFPQPGPITTIGSVEAGFFALGDLDGDGLDDVALAEFEILQWGRNTGNGAFELSTLDEGGSYGTHASIADVEGDGDLDIIFPASDASRFYLGDGKGGFEQVAAPPDLSNGVFGHDFDCDGHNDLVYGRGGVGMPPMIELWAGDGTGQFEKKSEHSTDSNLSFEDIGDVNQDGALDLILNGYPAPVFLGDSAWGLAPPISPWTFDFSGARMGDFDEDGAMDVAVMEYNLLQIWVAEP